MRLISNKRYEQYLKKKLVEKFNVKSIEQIDKLPNEISYLTWSAGQSEMDRSFKLIVTDKDNQSIELYVQIKSILWIIIRSMIWQKRGKKYERIKIKK